MIHGWSLRKRLIAVSAALTALAGIAIGMANLVGVRAFMIGQLDEDLSQTAYRLHTPDRDGDDISHQLNGPGLTVGTVLAAFDSAGAVTAVYLNSEANAQALSPNQLADIPVEEWGAEVRDVRIDGIGEYRMAVVGDSNGNTVLVGLSTASVDRVVSRIAAYQLALIAAVVALVILGGRKGVDMALRPLDRMRQTAQRVSALPLATGNVALTERVDVDDPDTEVGQLGNAFNQMLEHVDDALKVRQESEAKVRQFVSDASHELRTPLTAIRGYSELTRRTKQEMSPELSFALERIEAESIRMTAMVEDLLLLARLDEGREMELVETDFSTVVRNAVTDADTADSEHEWTAAVTDGITVMGDSHRLHQIIANLLGNARIHTPAGTHVVTTLVRNGDEAVLTVADNGPGIAPEVIDSLFERFTRADSSRTRATGSTGLGLAIVDGLVHAHHGSISVTSQPGATEFRITFPAL